MKIIKWLDSEPRMFLSLLTFLVAVMALGTFFNWCCP